MLKNTPDLNIVLNPTIFLILSHDGCNLKGQIDIRSHAISHDLKSSIWRNEGDRTISVKATKSDALVELDIIDLDTFSRWLIARLIIFLNQFIIDTKFALGHTT